jgi:hypothetical protein
MIKSIQVTKVPECGYVIVKNALGGSDVTLQENMEIEINNALLDAGSITQLIREGYVALKGD